MKLALLACGIEWLEEEEGKERERVKATKQRRHRITRLRNKKERKTKTMRKEMKANNGKERLFLVYVHRTYETEEEGRKEGRGQTTTT